MSAVIQPPRPMSARVVYKQDIVDPVTRIERLVDLWEPRIATRFLSSLREYRDQLRIDELLELIQRGDFASMSADFEALAQRIAATSGEAYESAARSTAEFLSRGLNIVIDFDQTNERAVANLRSNRLRLIREFTDDQIAVTRESLISGTERGLNPRQQAVEFRDSIGLTRRQHLAVNRYRNSLEILDRDVLRRQLRDRRFDSTIERAIGNNQPLSREQINRMTDRYRERFLSYRSRVIARSEALRAVHTGNVDMYSQAIDQGRLNDDELLRTWVTAADERVRGSHAPMNRRQVRGINSAFISGDGNPLRYPGDPDAPGSETVQCRCSVTTRIRRNV